MLDDGVLKQDLPSSDTYHRSNNPPFLFSVGWLGTCHGLVWLLSPFFFKKCFFRREKEESDRVSSTESTVGSDTTESTESTTILVQMKEENRGIRALSFVTKLSFVRVVKGFY